MANCAFAKSFVARCNEILPDWIFAVKGRFEPAELRPCINYDDRHSSITISSRYVHPPEDAVLNAMSRLSGHNIGHNDEKSKIRLTQKLSQDIEEKGQEWCARRGSNSRPNAPEAFALSS